MAGLMFFKDVTEQQAVATVTNSARQKAALLRPLSKVTNSTVEQWAAWNLIIVDRVFFFLLHISTMQVCLTWAAALDAVVLYFCSSTCSASASASVSRNSECQIKINSM